MVPAIIDKIATSYRIFIYALNFVYIFTICKSKWLRSMEEGSRSLGVGDTGGCEQPYLGAGNQTSSKHCVVLIAEPFL